MLTDSAAKRAFPSERRLTLGITLWLLSPIAVVVILSFLAAQQSLTRPVERAWVEVRKADESLSTPVDLALTWAVPDPLRAPGWGGGIIQSIAISPGSAIQDATEIARIDGVTILAVLSDEPFYRPIAWGTRGADVSALNDFLNRNGFATVEGDVAYAKTVAGIRAFGERIGLRDVSVFEPGWVVHLQNEVFDVGTIEIDPGTAPPALGEPIVSATNVLTAATVVPSGTFPTSSDAAPMPLDSSQIERRALDVPQDQRILLGEDELALTEDRSRVDAAGLTAIADSVTANMTSIQVNQVRSAGEGDVRVPSAAVFASATGSTCILIESIDRAVTIDVIADAGGSAIVRGDVDVGDRVEIRVTGTRRQCN